MAGEFSIKAYRTSARGLSDREVTRGYEKLRDAARSQGLRIKETGFYPVQEGGGIVYVFHGAIAEGKPPRRPSKH
jgi:hypothetical protein